MIFDYNLMWCIKVNIWGIAVALMYVDQEIILTKNIGCNYILEPYHQVKDNLF